MKLYKIEAMIRPHTLNEIRDALLSLGIKGMTVSDAKEYGRQKDHTETYRGDEYTVDMLPKIKIEIVCLEEKVEEITRTIVITCRTGKLGDGRIFVGPLNDVVRIRTSERGEKVVQEFPFLETE